MDKEYELERDRLILTALQYLLSRGDDNKQGYAIVKEIEEFKVEMQKEVENG